MTTRMMLIATMLATTSTVAMAQPSLDHHPGINGMGSKPTMGGHPGPMGMTGKTGMPAGQARMRGGEDFSPMMLNHIEGRIAFLKAEIGVTDGQAPQWTAFADALRSGTSAMRTAMAAQAHHGTATSAPDRTESMVKRMSAHLDLLKTMLAAEKPLYAVLSDDQKKIADELLPGLGMAPSMGMGPGMMQGMR